MPALTFAPALSLLAAFHRVSPVRPLRILLRTAEEKRHPSQARPYASTVTAAQDRVRASAGDVPRRAAAMLREAGRGTTPTIVLGGFVPDSTEQVFLLRGFFRRAGDLYYVNYPREGFDLDLVCAQLDDLVAELGAARGQPPVIFAVSFGAGLLLEWLARARRAGTTPALGGVVLVSPVACVADLVAPTGAKPATLLGRALQPYLDAADGASAGANERSRTIFARMFEAGAQNKAALRALMTPAELAGLRAAVMATIRGITPTGAWERVRALRTMAAPPAYFAPALLPLATVPALVLYAEREEAVLEAGSPTRFAFEGALRAYFPRGRLQTVATAFGPPVQHASLIFHAFDFQPALGEFYQQLKSSKLRQAA